MSTQAFVIEAARLMQPKRSNPELAEALHWCIATRGVLTLQLHPGEVILLSRADGPPPAGVGLVGRWRSPMLEDAHRAAGAALLLPFILLIEGIDLPHHQIYTLGRDDRSVADFFMRNVFLAACRRVNFVLPPRGAGASPGVTASSRDLSRTYAWIVKAALKEPVLQRGNAPELILAEAHVPLGVFDTSLLQVGAAALRAHAAGRAAAEHVRSSPSDVMRLRDEVMPLYRQ